MEAGDVTRIGHSAAGRPSEDCTESYHAHSGESLPSETQKRRNSERKYPVQLARQALEKIGNRGNIGLHPSPQNPTHLGGGNYRR